MPKIADLETPCVLIDARARRGKSRPCPGPCQRQWLQPCGRTSRPTSCPRFAARQVALGAVGITVQKLGEAEVMADAGSPTSSCPTTSSGATKLAPSRRAQWRVKHERHRRQRRDVAGYAATFGPDEPLTVLVECDTGGGRCGVQSPHDALALGASHRRGAGPQLRRTDDLSAAGQAGRCRPLAR